MVWSNPFDDTNYVVQIGVVYPDGPVELSADPASLTRTGATIVASDAFTGTVEVIAYRAGENPFCCPDDTALANLRKTIALWRPGKATCDGVYALVQGRYFDWPVATFAEIATFGPSTVVRFAAA